MLGGVGMPKSVSWDHSYAAALKIRADKAAEVARRAAKEDSRVKAAAAAVAVTMGGRGDPGQMPRSVSCSSLAPKRTLFPRSSSKDGLERGAPRRGSGAAIGKQSRRHILPHRRGVSFNTQVGGSVARWFFRLVLPVYFRARVSQRARKLDTEGKRKEFVRLSRDGSSTSGEVEGLRQAAAC